MARPRAWVDLVFSASVIDGADMAALDVMADLGIGKLDTITVVRLVGQLMAYPENATPPAAGVQRVDWGIGVVTDTSFVAGVVPLPDISTSYPARGWMIAGTKWVLSGGTGNQGAYPQWEFDIRTMRKVDKGILYISMGNNNLDGAAFQVRFGGRVRALCLT